MHEGLKAKKTPQWIGDAQAVHTFTYTPDAKRSVALLGNTPSAYGRPGTPSPARSR